MKIFKNVIVVVCFIAASVFHVACNNNAEKNNSFELLDSQSSETTKEEIRKDVQEEPRKEVQISGTYSGTDNLGMESTIILQNGGSLIIQPSVGDGTPDYGTWTGIANNLSLYHKDAMGNEELIGNAKVTEEGLRIIGGNFYRRQ
jgi:hypothetical protein